MSSHHPHSASREADFEQVGPPLQAEVVRSAGLPEPSAKSGLNSRPDWFHWFASETAHLSGRAISFSFAVLLILIWGLSGPLFGFSDTWQLVINTTTTIVTFLMVFLIQHAQNRDALALQAKLAELIIAAQGAQNRVAVAEDMNDEELQALHEAYCKRARETLASLNGRRLSINPAEEATRAQ